MDDDGGERLAAAGGHLDQRARACSARATPPGSRWPDLLNRQSPACSSGGIVRRLAAHLAFQADQAEQFFGSVEGEDLAAAGVGFEQVGELRDRAGASRSRTGRGRRWAGTPGGRAPAYLADCVSTPVRVMPFGLGLDDADRLGRRHRAGSRPRRSSMREFADGDPRAAEMFISSAVLDDPAALLELAVDVPSGFSSGVTCTTWEAQRRLPEADHHDRAWGSTFSSEIYWTLGWEQVGTHGASRTEAVRRGRIRVRLVPSSCSVSPQGRRADGPAGVAADPGWRLAGRPRS